MYLVNDSEASPTHALYNTEKQVQAYINKQIDAFFAKGGEVEVIERRQPSPVSKQSCGDIR